MIYVSFAIFVFALFCGAVRVLVMCSFSFGWLFICVGVMVVICRFGIAVFTSGWFW